MARYILHSNSWSILRFCRQALGKLNFSLPMDRTLEKRCDDTSPPTVKKVSPIKPNPLTPILQNTSMVLELEIQDDFRSVSYTDRTLTSQISLNLYR